MVLRMPPWPAPSESESWTASQAFGHCARTGQAPATRYRQGWVHFRGGKQTSPRWFLYPSGSAPKQNVWRIILYIVGKFNWKGTIKAVLKQAPDNEVAIKKLRKKVWRRNPGPEAGESPFFILRCTVCLFNLKYCTSVCISVISELLTSSSAN